MKALLAVLVLTSAVFVITVQPTAHDYGKTAVGGTSLMTFQVTAPAGARSSDSVTAVLNGRDAHDFAIRYTGRTSCFLMMGSGSCNYAVDFGPQSLGVKQASLVVTDTRGNRAVASLRGEGVVPLCKMEVVHCNYAHLYGGKFSWTSDLSAPQSRHHEQVDVELVGGLATCSGAASDTENGRTRTGPIAGMGLFAIEFERDSASRPVYRITVACPSPDWPAGPNGEPATPSKPAELGHDEQQSYDQPAPAPPGMKLVGSYTTPAAETDALNGVSGSLTVTWTLCPSAKYVVPPPTNAGQRLPRTCL